MMSSKVRAAAALLAFSAALLTGCGTLQDVHQATSDALAKSEELLKVTRDGATNGAVWRTSAPKIAGDEVKVKLEEKLPEVFERNFPYTTAGQPITATLEDISSQTGLRLVVLASRDSTSSTTGGAGSASSGASNAPPAIALEWNGKFRGLVDYIAQKLNASWRFNAERHAVEFFTEETRIFHITLPRKAKTVSSSISLNGAGGGGGGSSGGGGSGGGGGAPTGSVSVNSPTLTLDPYVALFTAVRSTVEANTGILSSTSLAGDKAGASGAGAGGGTGGELTSKCCFASRELAIISVTGTPTALHLAEELIDAVNRRYSRNVFISASIYSLTLSNEASAGASAQLLYKQLNKYGAVLQGSTILLPSSGAQPASLTGTVQSPTSPLVGSQLVFQALSSIGNVSSVIEGQVSAPNGQPAPMQDSQEVGFTSGYSVTQTANVGSTILPQGTSRVVGFTANFLPLVLGDNRILLDTDMTISSIQLQQAGPASAPTQNALVSTTAVQNTTYLHDGESIVLFGVDRTRNESNSSSSFGGLSKTGKRDRSVSVIVVTAFGGGPGEHE